MKTLINPNLEKTLDELFPKGDKARGRALALFATANIEIYTAENRIKKKLKSKMIKEIKNKREKYVIINLNLNG